MKVVLISTYELGRQPFGLASPAAWLRRLGVQVRCLDLAVEQFDAEAVRGADLVAFYLPMHTATRLAIPVAQRVAALSPSAHLCFYGLYAPQNVEILRSLGAGTILGGEFEEGLCALVERLRSARETGGPVGPQSDAMVSLAKQRFLLPERSGLPPLERYAQLDLGPLGMRTVGYTEATRGCRHRCRHCPIVPVYDGALRVVQRDVVLSDIAGQVADGAQHITFGDPDFFNGVGHALAIVNELHERFPDVTYDVTIKIEHLLRHAKHLPTLLDTGCAFVTSAVEAVDDRILRIFDKNHTRQDFMAVVSLFRDLGLVMNPTFVAFTPWTTLGGFVDLLAVIAELELVENVAPIQYAIRLLLPDGSLLLELSEVQEVVGAFDPEALCHRWTHPDPRVDRLQEAILATLSGEHASAMTRVDAFEEVWRLAAKAYRDGTHRPLEPHRSFELARLPIPQMTEPWFC